jgi:pyridoxine kinase
MDPVYTGKGGWRSAATGIGATEGSSFSAGKGGPEAVRALTIGGVDSLSGGGIGGDLTVFSQLGAFGLAAVTSTVSVFGGFVEISPVADDALEAQLRSILRSSTLDGIKIGLLNSPSQVAIVRNFVAKAKAENPDLVVVLDPVFSLKEDDKHSNADVALLILDQLLPLSDLVTPNMDEWKLYKGHDPDSKVPVLVKNTAPKSGSATDVLVTTAQEEVDGKVQGKLQEEVFSAPLIKAKSTNGAGCTLSAALTVALANGASLPDAVRASKEFTRAAISNLQKMKRGGSVWATAN